MRLSSGLRTRTGGSANQAQGSESYRRQLTGAAAESGNIDLLMWLKDGQPWDADAWYAVFENAAKGGHVPIMQWAVAEAPAEDPAFDVGPVDDDNWDGMEFWYELLSSVCGNGHLLVLHYLSELHGDTGVIGAAGSTYDAVAGGHVGVLQYLLECGCEWDDELEGCAENPQSLPAWQWIHEVRVPPPGEPPGSRLKTPRPPLTGVCARIIRIFSEMR